MAIKTRKSPTAAEIEAFGDAADKPSAEASTTAPSPAPAADPAPVTRVADTPPAPPRQRRAAPPQASSPQWPEGLAKTLTLRYPDPTIPQLLAELAELDERSQHNTAIRALRRGLDDLKREAGL